GHGEGVDAGRVRIGALDVAVPGHGGGDVGILRREVQRQRTTAAETSHADALGARPALLPREVGRDLDVSEILRARDLARDRTHLLEVLALHPALTAVELGRDGVIAGVSKATAHVLVLLAVAGEPRDHNDDGILRHLLRPGVVDRDLRSTRIDLLVLGND